MSLLSVRRDLDSWMIADEVPLVRDMFALAACMVRRVVVRRPVGGTFDAELIHEGADGPVHELIGRTGILLRAPVMLLRLPRPAGPRAAQEERPRRA